MPNFELKTKKPYLFYDGQPYDFPVGDGWYSILIEAFRKISETFVDNNVPLEEFTLLDIKEKFGGLRIYYGSLPDVVFYDVEAAVVEAENQSYSTCEECGKPGSLRKVGWMKTLCDAHANKYNRFLWDK